MAAPSIALAAWWNPLSWNIFSVFFRTESQVQNESTSTLVSQTQIDEVVVATTTATTTNDEPVSSSKDSKPQKPTKAVSDQSIQNHVQTPRQVQTTGTLCNGTYWASCPSGQNLICPQSGNAFCQIPQPSVQIPQQATTSPSAEPTTTSNVSSNLDKGTPYKAQDGNWYYPNAFDTNGRNLQVIVPGPKVAVTINPSSIEYGGTATISWTASGATSCTLNSSPILLAPTGSQTTGVLTTSTTYIFSCIDKDGTASGSATANVQPWAPPPGVKVLPEGECTQFSAPCTTGPGGWSCSKDGCGG